LSTLPPWGKGSNYWKHYCNYINYAVILFVALNTPALYTSLHKKFRTPNATDDCLNDRLDLLKEADELTAILTAIIIKVKVKKKK